MDHTRYTDIDFEQQFANCTFKPGMFSHEAHLRLAYIHISKYGEAQAAENMVSQIKTYAEHYGVKEKFNKTVTISAVKIMSHYMSSSSTNSFSELVNEFPILTEDFKSILSQHYSFNVFGDSEAKKEFIAPDLRPFPVSPRDLGD